MSKTIHPNRWAILAAACVLVFCTGSIYAFSVFRDALADKFTLDQTMTAYSINSGIAPIPMILGGLYVDRGKSKWMALLGGVLFGGGWILSGVAPNATVLIISYGIIAGLGQGMAYAAGLNNTLRFFPDRRGLAAGLITGANGGATIIMAPVAQRLLDSQGVGTMLIILGSVFIAVGIIVAIIIKPAPADYAPPGAKAGAGAAAAPPPIANVGWRQMLATPMFWLIFAMFVCGAFAGLMIVANASPIAQGMYAYSPQGAATFVSLYAFASLAGRIGFGMLSDRLGRIRTVQVIFSAATVGLLVLVLGKGDHNAVALSIGLLGIGTAFGGILGVMPTLVMSQFGPKNQGINYGIAFSAYAVAAIFAPRIGASIGEANDGDFSRAFFIAIGAAVAGIVLAVAYERIARAREVRQAAQERASAGGGEPTAT
ncbi:MAG: OFA family MFS transporter [Actinomycetaceae bacterium]|nr:OFA family MFS transporter [Actinomycetaceae bacterium]